MLCESYIPFVSTTAKPRILLSEKKTNLDGEVGGGASYRLILFFPLLLPNFPEKSNNVCTNIRALTRDDH